MDGTVDFAHSTPARESGTIKDIAALEIPGFYSGGDWLTFTSAIDEALTDIYSDYDIKYIGAVYEGEATFVAIGKQIEVPADLNGMAFRAAGAWFSKAVEAWGGSPTTIPLNELASALERHTVDGAFAPWPVTVPQKLYEVADHVTFTNISNFGTTMMSQKVYDGLTTAQQAVIDQVSSEWSQINFEVGGKFYDQYYKEVGDYGTEVYKLSAEENKAFSDLTVPLFEEYANTCTEKGKALLDAINSIE
jgi:TRAP-type C4-dicarboxylate transport system substrate-binding protein